MTITNGYTTLAAIKTQKDISSVDAADDSLIERIIEGASRYIDNATGRRFYTTTNDETRTFTAVNGRRCYVDDLISITTLKTDDIGSRTYPTTWATTDYDLLPANAALVGWPYMYLEAVDFGRYSFPQYRKGVQIVGKFGFPACPADVELACRLIAINIYSNRFGQSNQGAATVTGAGVVITPSDIPASVAKLLAPYGRTAL